MPGIVEARSRESQAGHQISRADLDVWNVLRDWQVGKAMVAHSLGTVRPLQMAPAPWTGEEWSRSTEPSKALEGIFTLVTPLTAVDGMLCCNLKHLLWISWQTRLLPLIVMLPRNRCCRPLAWFHSEETVCECPHTCILPERLSIFGIPCPQSQAVPMISLDTDSLRLTLQAVAERSSSTLAAQNLQSSLHLGF